jgi:hypothetical protein
MMAVAIEKTPKSPGPRALETRINEANPIKAHAISDE